MRAEDWDCDPNATSPITAPQLHSLRASMVQRDGICSRNEQNTILATAKERRAGVSEGCEPYPTASARKHQHFFTAWLRRQYNAAGNRCIPLRAAGVDLLQSRRNSILDPQLNSTKSTLGPWSATMARLSRVLALIVLGTASMLILSSVRIVLRPTSRRIHRSRLPFLLARHRRQYTQAEREDIDRGIV